MAQARGTFDTARNQPMRVRAIAWPFSQETLAISKGISTWPMPDSMANCCPLSGAKVDRIEGATELCRQPVTLPVSSMATSMRSADVVWKKL